MGRRIMETNVPSHRPVRNSRHLDLFCAVRAASYYHRKRLAESRITWRQAIVKTVKVSAKSKIDKTNISRLVNDLKLDRRKLYCVGMSGELATVEVSTVNCSGCSCDCGDGYGCSHGCSGCEWCGYTGKRKTSFPDPVRVGEKYIQVYPAKCSRCGVRIDHFDSGCQKCQK